MIGFLGAAATHEFLSSLLFDVTRLDLMTHGAVAFAMALIAAAACWIPASRAARLEPSAILRSE
ncbi:MAG: hypothetical protein RQ745_01050 [Longimicrobiales bacterium]|nr:hypothetical protein [Longimicrobiales bacterium]